MWTCQQDVWLEQQSHASCWPETPDQVEGPKPRWSKNENARFNYDLISPIFVSLIPYSNMPV